MPTKKTSTAKKTTTQRAAKKTTTQKAAKKAPTKAPKRMAAKVSPVRGMAVADWVKTKVTGWQAEMVARLLAIASRAAPKATVSIKWGQPVLEHNGPFAFIKPAKAHVTFGFWRGAELAGLSSDLEGGERMKHLKIQGPTALDEKTLAALVREAFALNEKKGDPTKR